MRRAIRAGYPRGKTAPSVSFSYALIGSVLSTVLLAILPVIGGLAYNWQTISVLADPSFYIFGTFLLAYAVSLPFLVHASDFMAGGCFPRQIEAR
jgi:hypothetical protein